MVLYLDFITFDFTIQSNDVESLYLTAKATKYGPPPFLHTKKKQEKKKKKFDSRNYYKAVAKVEMLLF